MMFASTALRESPGAALPSSFGKYFSALLIVSIIVWILTIYFNLSLTFCAVCNVLVTLCILHAMYLIYVIQSTPISSDQNQNGGGAASSTGAQSNQQSSDNTPNSELENSSAPETNYHYQREISIINFDDDVDSDNNGKDDAAKWKFHLILTLILAGLLFVTSYNEKSHFYVSMRGLFSSVDWHRTLFILSFGAYLACLLQFALDQSSVRHSASVCLPLVMALLSVVCLVAAGWMMKTRHNPQASQIQTYLGMDSDTGELTSYQGQAHVRGVALLEDRECTSKRDALQVQIDVLWGGSWGCPTSPNTYCEDSIESFVPCIFSDKQFDDYNAEQDPSLYVSLYYQDYPYDEDFDMSNFDDDAFDPDTAPQGTSWNGPKEFIVGNCQTCQARALPNVMMDLHEITRTLHEISLLSGIGLFGVAWLLLAGLRLWRSRSITANPSTETFL